MPFHRKLTYNTQKNKQKNNKNLSYCWDSRPLIACYLLSECQTCLGKTSSAGLYSGDDGMILDAFISTLLASKRTKCSTKFTQGHPRSSKLAPKERAYATSYRWLIVTITLSLTVSEISRCEHVKTPHSHLAPPKGLTPFEFQRLTFHGKTRSIGLYFSEDHMILGLIRSSQ